MEYIEKFFFFNEDEDDWTDPEEKIGSDSEDSDLFEGEEDEYEGEEESFEEV